MAALTTHFAKKGLDISAIGADDESIAKNLLDQLDGAVASPESPGLPPPAANAPDQSNAILIALTTAITNMAAPATSTQDPALKHASKNASDERRKLTLEFNRTVDDAVKLLHAATRSSEIEGNYVPAAQFIAGKVSSDVLNTIIVNVTATVGNQPWKNTQYHEFCRAALIAIHGKTWMKTSSKPSVSGKKRANNPGYPPSNMSRQPSTTQPLSNGPSCTWAVTGIRHRTTSRSGASTARNAPSPACASDPCLIT